MQTPPTSANLRILQNLRFFAVNNKTQKDRLRYQCTPKLTISPNFSYRYSQVHLIDFFQLRKVLRKKVSPRQSYNKKRFYE